MAPFHLYFLHFNLTSEAIRWKCNSFLAVIITMNLQDYLIIKWNFLGNILEKLRKMYKKKKITKRKQQMNEKKMKCIKFSFFNLLLFLSLILSNLNISSILKTSEFRILKKKEKKTYSVKFFFFYISCLHSNSPLSC